MKKILIIEDRPEIQELISITIQPVGASIHQAFSGEQGLAMAKELEPDLVLLDVMMPTSSYSGLDVCKILRSSPQTENSAILILSAKSQATDVAAALEAGADTFMSKPFSPTKLL